MAEDEVVSIDLAATEDLGAGSRGLPHREEVPYDPAEAREKIRGRIAQILVWLLVGLVAMALASVTFSPGAIAPVKQVLDLVLAPIVGLVGAVTGFYYGEKSKS